MDNNTKLETAKEIIARQISIAMTRFNLSTKDDALVSLLNIKEKVDSCDMPTINYVLKLAKEGEN